MKNKKLQRMLSMAIAMMMALTVMLSSTAGVFAAPNYFVSAPDVMYSGQPRHNIDVFNAKNFKDITPTSVKSSKPSVVKITKDSWTYDGKKITNYLADAKKTGKATITVKFKVKGKTKTLKHTITVKKYPNQIKSLKVNGKKVKLKGEKRYNYDVKCSAKATKGTIKIALKKGWKIQKVYGYYNNYKTGKYQDIKNESKLKNLVKNGKAISFPKKWDAMGIGINMKKGDQYINYHIYLERKK